MPAGAGSPDDRGGYGSRVSELSRTPLYDRHVALGAKTADFGGWDMPIEYTGVVAEHAAVRTDVGVFDVSHMGKVRIHGPGAAAFVNAVLANDLDRIGDGRAQYSMLLTSDGGIVDDLIVYRWGDDEIFVINSGGTVIRMPVRDISSQGRDATGVRVMNLDTDTTVAAVAPVLGADDD